MLHLFMLHLFTLYYFMASRLCVVACWKYFLVSIFRFFCVILMPSDEWVKSASRDVIPIFDRFRLVKNRDFDSILGVS